MKAFLGVLILSTAVASSEGRRLLLALDSNSTDVSAPSCSTGPSGVSIALFVVGAVFLLAGLAMLLFQGRKLLRRRRGIAHLSTDLDIEVKNPSVHQMPIPVPRFTRTSEFIPADYIELDAPDRSSTARESRQYEEVVEKYTPTRNTPPTKPVRETKEKPTTAARAPPPPPPKEEDVSKDHTTETAPETGEFYDYADEPVSKHRPAPPLPPTSDPPPPPVTEKRGTGSGDKAGGSSPSLRAKDPGTDTERSAVSDIYEDIESERSGESTLDDRRPPSIPRMKDTPPPVPTPRTAVKNPAREEGTPSGPATSMEDDSTSRKDVPEDVSPKEEQTPQGSPTTGTDTPPPFLDAPPSVPNVPPAEAETPPSPPTREDTPPPFPDAPPFVSKNSPQAKAENSPTPPTMEDTPPALPDGPPSVSKNSPPAEAETSPTPTRSENPPSSPNVPRLISSNLLPAEIETPPTFPTRKDTPPSFPDAPPPISNTLLPPGEETSTPLVRKDTPPPSSDEDSSSSSDQYVINVSDLSDTETPPSSPDTEPDSPPSFPDAPPPLPDAPPPLPNAPPPFLRPSFLSEDSSESEGELIQVSAITVTDTSPSPPAKEGKLPNNIERDPYPPRRKFHHK